ncbi:von Willebrand factor type a domain motif-containing protein [Pandoravirus inopinatum]|uniref:von Willebrand factor type a domain motif-containing protein n=1 Tax=Pandoravirus inopinatum TaxID=1605721 RepID=A0A0B5IZV9_9VIRU|nr:von Willebrand factor type a domain motif-containing protein [Pandoravirus inopinatum]AJF98503.1 von Willebrand factor type a domain motif-containing protein [Pandoravirus inopinatum]
MGARVGAARTPAQRVRLMRRTVAASRERVASIRDTHLVSRAAPADMAAYVNSMGAAKYGAAALKRAAAANMAPYDAESIMRALAQARPVETQSVADNDSNTQRGDDDDDGARVRFLAGDGRRTVGRRHVARTARGRARGSRRPH